MSKLVCGFFLLSFSILFGCSKKTSLNCNTNICPDSLRVVIKRSETQTICHCKKNIITLHFSNVVDDSRCPTGTTCVWAGTAYVLLTLSTNDRLLKVELGKTISVKLDSISYHLTLETLTPYPADSIRINPADYQATLFFKKV